ncbi:hypothetical protein EX30DRAFT_224173 [Ascodesmis nigricans]|uniref:Uncharacterized protein n=1 Tax=Ascodesmis nigricans TaxID=341454 RepID=A0A4S2MJD9_9PEZI|nr:hypothetical protein EX30DRAFT_224173 [Ascodesmis nigricans]
MRISFCWSRIITRYIVNRFSECLWDNESTTPLCPTCCPFPIPSPNHKVVTSSPYLQPSARFLKRYPSPSYMMVITITATAILVDSLSSSTTITASFQAIYPEF